MTIGVLAIQGDFIEHIRVLRSLHVLCCEVRTVTDLASVDALILPGGESTTISKFLREGGLMNAIHEKGKADFPLFGTCAGAILLAKKIRGQSDAHLGLIDIEVERNSYGRQLESFIDTVISEDPEKKLPDFQAAFIRAPRFVDVSGGNDSPVRILGRCHGDIVVVHQGNILAATCHPELLNETILHEYFLNSVLKHHD